MRAVLSKEKGGPESLVVEELEAPSAGKGQVLIVVKSVGVNFPDSLIIQDLYQFKPERPFSPGGECSGVIEALGEGVEGFNVGDRVLATMTHGAMSSKVVVPAQSAHKIPDSMPFDDASALLLTYGTSIYALDNRGSLKEGESLFVLGAAGGVGLASVQLGKAMGAKVIAGCSTQEKVDLCLEHGADEGIVYDRQPLDRDQQKELSNKIKAAGGGGVDVVYDAVGGDYSEPAVRALNWEGRFLVIGFPAGIAKLPLNLTLLKSCQIVGVFWGAWTSANPKEFAASVQRLFDMYDRGQIKPYISSRYTLDTAPAAITELIERKAKGKIVVEI